MNEVNNEGGSSISLEEVNNCSIIISNLTERDWRKLTQFLFNVFCSLTLVTKLVTKMASARFP